MDALWRPLGSYAVTAASTFGLLACLGVGSLFGFPDEAARFVEVNAAVARGAVAVVELDGFLKDEQVPGLVRDSAFRLGQVEQLAEPEDESVLVGRFGSGGAGVLLDEVFNGHGWR